MSPPFFPIPQALVDEFKTQMIQVSKHEDWSDRLISAGRDKKKLQIVLRLVFYHYSWIVSKTALKKNVIGLSALKDINKLVESLNDDEFEEWKSIVQKGDWEGLITHRMCLARSRRRYFVIWYWHSETSETT